MRVPQVAFMVSSTQLGHVYSKVDLVSGSNSLLIEDDLTMNNWQKKKKAHKNFLTCFPAQFVCFFTFWPCLCMHWVGTSGETSDLNFFNYKSPVGLKVNLVIVILNSVLDYRFLLSYKQRNIFDL